MTIPVGLIRSMDGTPVLDVSSFLDQPATEWPPVNLLTALQNLFTGQGEAAAVSLASLPKLVGAVRAYDDASPATLRVISLGSSVGLGPNGGGDPVNTLPNYLFAALEPVVNRLGNMTFTNTNGSVGGTTVFDGRSTDYTAAKAAAGGLPTLVPLIYGMNDGTSAQYHGGETYPGVYTEGAALIRAIRADGGDPIIFTTPHPHTTRTSWAYGGAINYPPGGIAIPALNTAASIVTVDTRNGATAPASYRHLRVNETFRQLAADFGCVLIDAEPYWFDAVATYGEDALYDPAETVHPNLFGFQQSYFRAVDNFVSSLTRPIVLAGAPLIGQTQRVYRVDNTTRNSIVLSADNQLVLSPAAAGVYLVRATIFYTTPTAADMSMELTAPAGSSGRWGVIGYGTNATAIDSDASARSVTLAPGTYLNIGGNTADCVAVLEGLVTVGATAGSFGIKFSQAAASGTTTIYANSFLESTRLT